MGYGVSAAPNASDVHAKVKGTKRAGEIATIRLFIVEAKDYDQMPNFVKDKIGKEIEITVSKDDLKFFERAEVDILISVAGDEKGQSYTARIKP